MNNMIVMKNVQGNVGFAEIRWIPDNEHSVAHYDALISVPFQKCRWENLFVYERMDLEKVKEKTKMYLEIALDCCTFCS